MILDTNRYNPDSVYELSLNSRFWHAAVCRDLAPHYPEKSWVVVLRWGYKGMPGHVNYKYFRNRRQAVRYLYDRKRDKLCKGYTQDGADSVPELDALDMRPIRTESSPTFYTETDWDLL